MPAAGSDTVVPRTLKEKVRRLPDRPGVYLMKDRIGRIIYVGKAKALKRRVSSYFQPSRAFALHPKIRALVEIDRKSTRLNSSHLGISYAVFCLKKKHILNTIHLQMGLVIIPQPRTSRRLNS